MTRTVAIIAGVVILIVVVAAGFALFRTPEEASAPIEAVPLVVETAEPVAAATATSEPVSPTDTPPAEATAANSQPTIEPAGTSTPQPEAELAAAPSTGPVIFEIVPVESQARFIIDEVLRGSPKTVVGATDQVSGQLAVDSSDPSSAQVGTILVNARTLATDSSMRDRALKNRILQTDSYEFVTFEPVEVIGLPASITIGEAFDFQIAGDLTVRDLVVPVTFNVTVTPVSETRLEGLATLTMPYRDLNVTIPDSPSVDTVADELTLELEFVAVPASGV